MSCAETKPPPPPPPPKISGPLGEPHDRLSKLYNDNDDDDDNFGGVGKALINTGCPLNIFIAFRVFRLLITYNYYYYYRVLCIRRACVLDPLPRCE